MSEDNKISKAQQKAVNKYVKNNYDRVNVTFPKGQKEKLREHAQKQDESVNAFIVRSVSETMERDKQHMPISKGGYVLYEPEAAKPPYPPNEE